MDQPTRHDDSTTMKTFLLRFFTWWNGQTFGTQLWTARFGALVGEDEFGNRYYRTKGRKIDPMLGFERRWVVYNGGAEGAGGPPTWQGRLVDTGVAEATCVPPTWHGWLHHRVHELPSEEQVTPPRWWKPHQPNLTGTP